MPGTRDGVLLGAPQAAAAGQHGPPSIEPLNTDTDMRELYVQAPLVTSPSQAAPETFALEAWKLWQAKVRL